MYRKAISANQITKAFRRFQHPSWRALDALGVRVPQRKYDNFFALRDISIEVGRGEKVALIGRNGAGKSTLLRIIANQVKPDSGRVEVDGRVQALMELGTGFHPDFTGRNNIRSALAYHGIPARSANRTVDDIIEFTELEEFIDRPVREYSAGMYARLAFAVATSITPDILIIDEILGAGDAYFIGKCLQRMRRLTSEGATILFVSHDMSAIHLLCERAIWIEQGRIRADGDVLGVTKAYLASVRHDEEIRIRARSMSLTRGQVASSIDHSKISIFRLIGVEQNAPVDPAAVAEIRFGSSDSGYNTICPDSDDGLSKFIVQNGQTNWSGTKTYKGRLCRQFGDFKGKFTHAPWQVDWSDIQGKDVWMEIDILPSASHAINVELYDNSKQQYVGIATLIRAQQGKEWTTLRLFPKPEETHSGGHAVQTENELQELHPQDRYGSGPIKLSGFAFFDDTGVRRHTLVSGGPAKAVLSYMATKPVVNPVAVLAVYRPDGTCAMQITSNRQGSSIGVLEGKGQITVSFDPLYLGPGEYVVSVALFKELNLASGFEPEAYDLHDRCYALKIMPPPGMKVEIGTVYQPALWEILR